MLLIHTVYFNVYHYFVITIWRYRNELLSCVFKSLIMIATY